MPRTRLSRRKRLVFAAFTVVAVGFLGLLLLEIILIWHASAYPINGVHDGKWSTWGHPVRLNSLGFRGEEPAPPDAPGLRILVLGDSLTFGVGVAEEDRYTEILAELLAAETGAPVHVFNLGRSGASTTEELRVLERHLDQLQPDLIVVGMCVNDVVPREQSERGRASYATLFSFLDLPRRIGLHHSASFLTDRSAAILERLGFIPDLDDILSECYAVDSAEWRATRGALESMSELARQRGLPPPVAAVLPEGSLSGKRELRSPDRYDRLQELARSVGLSVSWSGQAFGSLLASDAALFVNELDAHPSAACHRVYATELVASVLALLEEE